MENREKKGISYYMRSLHRDIGFLLIGLTIIYCLSGLVLIFRDTDFLKYERQIERKLSSGIAESDLASHLRLRSLEVQKTEGDIVYFNNGTYNKTTGVATYSEKGLPSFLQKINNIHKAPSQNATHWFSLIFSIALFFMAISSFWMYKIRTKKFRRGLILTGLGIIVAIAMILM